MKYELTCPGCGFKPRPSAVFTLPNGATACTRCRAEIEVVKQDGTYKAVQARRNLSFRRRTLRTVGAKAV